FAGFGTLVGGSAADTFTFADGAAVTGTIDGGAGTNALNYAAYTTPVVVNLATNMATGAQGLAAGGILHFQRVTGGSAASTLDGPNTTNTWSLTGSNAGAVSGFTFTGFGALVGGSVADTFNFAAGAAVTGAIDGGGGTNALSYAA